MFNFNHESLKCGVNPASSQKVGKSTEWHRPCSEQQCSAGSPTLLTFFGREAQYKKKEGRERRREVKNIAGISHQSWPDFVLLLSLFCPSWLRVDVFLEQSCCVFTSLKAATPQTLASNCSKNAEERERVCGNVQLDSM